MDWRHTIIAGMSAVVMICLTIIGWFMVASLKESRDNTLQIGIINGIIKANKTKSHDDVQSLSRETDIKIQHLTDQTMELAKSVNRLMDLIIDNKFGKE